MHRLFTAFCLSAFLALPALGAATNSSTANEEHAMSDQQAVSAAIDSFYAALNILFTGDGKPMKDAWSHANDISYMGPEGAYLVGWDKIGPLWDNIAAAKLGGHVSPVEVHSIFVDGLALVTCVESGENIVDGTATTVRIRSSTVFRREDGNWKVVHHQTDLLQFMGK